MKQIMNKDEQFELLGQTFDVEHYPHLYGMVQVSRENAEAQLQSIANAWHDGSIVSAAQAFESDLAHG